MLESTQGKILIFAIFIHKSIFSFLKNGQISLVYFTFLWYYDDYFTIYRREGTSLFIDNLVQMTVLLKLYVQVLLGLFGMFFVPSMDAIDLVECALVARGDVYLLEFAALLALSFLLIELLYLFPQPVRCFFLSLPTLALVVFVLLVDISQMPVIEFCHFGFLGFDGLLIFGNLLSRCYQLLLKAGSPQHILILLLSIELQLESRSLDRKVYLISLI
jgi:hypothetical protein